MSHPDIEAIRYRFACGRWTSEDVAFLCSEVEKWRDAHDNLSRARRMDLDKVERERDALRAENERLKAESERKAIARRADVDERLISGLRREYERMRARLAEAERLLTVVDRERDSRRVAFLAGAE